MEKTSKSIYRSLSSVTVYRDDIEKVVDILKLGGHEVTATGDGYKYANIDEAFSNPDESFKGFRLECACPNIWVTFRDSGDVSIMAFHDDITSEGVVSKIHEFLLKKRRKTSKLIAYFLQFMSISSAMLSLFFYQITGEMRSFLLLLILPIDIWYQVWGGGHVIHKDRKNDRPSFFKRNHDTLIVGAISGTVGTVLGAMVLWLITKQPPN